jgi:AbrB family looped-hinge helix DNA binding protein
VTQGLIAVSAMITSKITSKGQTTIPHPVRSALRVGEGDELAYRIEGDHGPDQGKARTDRRSVRHFP